MNRDAYLAAIHQECAGATGGTISVTDGDAVAAVRSMRQTLGSSCSVGGWASARREVLTDGSLLFAVLAEGEAGQLGVTAHVGVAALQSAWLRARDAVCGGFASRQIRASALEGRTVMDPEGNVYEVDEVLVNTSTGRLTFHLHDLDEDGEVVEWGESEVDDLEDWVLF